MAKKTQWHPAFVALLRLLVEPYFEVQPDMPVGDKPREADVVLLRRRRSGRLPFQGLWRDLTAWNVLEFKGPTVSPREEDPDQFVEVGLGIHRRLNEERERQKRPPLGPEQVSFWYLANHLGRRLLSSWGRRRLRGLRQQSQGVWRCEVMGRLVFVVRGDDLPADQEDNLPLLLLDRDSSQKDKAVAEFVASRQDLWDRYGAWLSALHFGAYEEVKSMAKATRPKSKPIFQEVIDAMGMDWLIDQLGAERLMEAMGTRRFIKAVGIKKLWEELTPEERREWKRLADE